MGVTEQTRPRPTIQTEVGAPPHQHYLPSSMQVFRPNPGSPGDPRKHPRTDLLGLMECEDEIGEAVTRKCPV
jgi:hypothetical protein